MAITSPTLDGLPRSTRATLDIVGQRDVFSSRAWFELLLTHCPSGGEPLFWANDGCVLPLIRDQRTLRSLTNFYTMRFSPIFDNESPTSPYVDTIIQDIRESRPSWEAVQLRNLPGAEPITGYVLDLFRRNGWRARLYFQSENWFYPAKGVSARAYFESRPSQLRNTVERKWRKGNREHEMDFRLYRRPDQVAVAVADYGSIYAKSWKDPERFASFMPALISHCADRDALRLGVLYVDGVPAAAQFWIVAGSRATIYKLAYDAAYAQLSVGSLLTKLMFDYVLDHDDVDEVDYGTGSDAYKRDWMQSSRPMVGLIAYNPRTPSGFVSAATDIAMQGMKRLLRREGAVAPASLGLSAPSQFGPSLDNRLHR